ncbi:MAG: hypothetical protein IPI82_09135 [Candidatus Microthrix sp.]|nr:hypothetical protein [Candidatus Microthrix sp.]MBK7322602.1 hypothetical protein [Candidatus Microthrix sp.]
MPEADKLRIHDFGRPSLIGTPGQLQEQLAAYAEAGVDELIIPDFTLGGGAEQDETLDRFRRGGGARSDCRTRRGKPAVSHG